MRSFMCCVLLMGVMTMASPVPFNMEPAKLDTPDDQDVVQAAPAAGGTGINANPQGGSPAGSSFFLPAGDSSSSSSSSEEYYGSDAGTSVGIGSVPAGTAVPGSGPVVGAGTAGGAAAQGGQGAGQTGGKQQVSDQNSGEKSGGGGLLVAGDTARLSGVQGSPKTDSTNRSSAGKSAGIAIGVLGLISVAIVAIIFAIRKRRDGFMRFYSQANAEL